MKTENTSARGRIRIHQENDELMEYRKKEKKHKNAKMSRLWVLLIIWIGLVIVSMCVIVPYDKWDYSLAYLVDNTSTNIRDLYEYLIGRSAGSTTGGIFWQYIGAALVGAALSACGASFQGSFKNVLAGPSTMGVMAGGTLGCTLYMLLFVPTTQQAVNVQTQVGTYVNQTLWQQYQSELCILAGCIGGVLLVLGVSIIAGKGKLSSSTMIVSGMVFSTIVSNITMIVQYYILIKDPEDERIEAIKDLMMGNVTTLNNPQIVAMMGIPIIVALVVLMILRGKLNLLSFGEEEAKTMGVNVYAYRNIMIILGTILTAMVVSFCGKIGFLGFMVPLVSRKIAGPNLKKLLPVSILMGMILMTVVYDIARIVNLTSYLNVITSSVGCVVMVIVLLKKRRAKCS
ncbi:FecCD family ABC transporter permease [Eubacterium oxidoreducens]|nr:iron ABC transporter permease [Eubacterium oxidoreducens]